MIGFKSHSDDTQGSRPKKAHDNPVYRVRKSRLYKSIQGKLTCRLSQFDLQQKGAVRACGVAVADQAKATFSSHLPPLENLRLTFCAGITRGR